ncbi:MAG: hypothetical protein UT09_C0051G0010 [Parcubacteria group bacterium GW2011_GWF2_38_8]|nr:MAG: hypothetical protein UT09_C0051G0010 [Parcubacteria group bacterium GW2011_GWF2_38_8]
MKKICKNCKKDFEIEKKDLDFYARVDSPTPNYCPECRAQRRLAFRNERTLYKRNCDLCQKGIISLYPTNTSFPVYCHDCWWGDSWDAKNFGMDYNPSKTFFGQFTQLQNKVPRLALNVLTSTNSEYTNNSGDNKNCYLIFAAEQNEDCLYGRLIQHCKASVDCAFLYDSELCYECIDCRGLYNSVFSERCQSSTDLLFCFNMRDSNNCIFCTNGRHLSNAILNKKYNREEFLKKKEEILSSREKLEAAKKEFEELKKRVVVKYAFQTKCNDATGDYLFNCHEAKMLFDASNAKACAYLADAEDPIDTYDCNNIYYKPELCYDLMGILQCYKSKHSDYIFYCNEVEYSSSCYNTTSCFGCIGVKKGEYMILNKQYEKVEYEKIKKTIIENMKKEGTYGQFFSPELSPFGYNETLAQEYSPMTKDEAAKNRFNWQEQATGTYGKETIREKEIPETIEEVTEDILKEILICEDCKKNYRITKSEFDFYKRINIPLPRKDFECRHKDRMAKRNPRKLWHRKCMKEGCPNEFETSYSPERPEMVFCETCYQQEVY